MEAHRMREQKWMNLISSTSSSQARKNKKVKRLILDGVPSSVRGKAWGHITDAKARRMEGLLTQLVKKAPSHFIPLVERDVERCFGDVQHLRDPTGPLASLILAYTAMVPDIRYRTGLTLIAGHLLLQAPDEDAFWMFVAIMHSHLRGYYQIHSQGQLEVDSNLFKSVVQAADPELAKRLFEDYGVRPIDICGPWCVLYP
jgi:TBC1 domain family member 10